MKGFTQHSGKGSKQQTLPNRHAVNELTKGEPWQRSINNYAKVTPSIDNDTPDTLDMAQVKY